MNYQSAVSITYIYNINNVKNKVAKIIPSAVRFTISTGLTIAKPHKQWLLLQLEKRYVQSLRQ